MRQFSLIEKSELLAKALGILVPAGSYRIASVEYCLARDPELSGLALLPCFRKECPSVNVFFDAAAKNWPYPSLGIPVFPPVASQDFGTYRRLVEWYRNDINLIPLASEDFQARFSGDAQGPFADIGFCIGNIADQCDFKFSSLEAAEFGKMDVARMILEMSVLARCLPADHPAKARAAEFFRSLDVSRGCPREFFGGISLKPTLGVVKGVARFIDGENPEPVGGCYNKFSPGDVLLARNTTVRYMRYLLVAGAVVTVNPNRLSHASIVCAELAKPCVLGVSGLLLQVFDGDEVSVDPQNAKVEVLKRFYERE